MSAPQINISDVASLARLTLTPDETVKFSAQLTQILGHMETLSQIATGAVRQDIPTSSLSIEAALSNAPAQANDLILVPRILE